MKLVLWLLVAVAVVYGLYSGAMALWSHLEVQDIVEVVVAERARADRFERAARGKEDVLRRAARRPRGGNGFPSTSPARARRPGLRVRQGLT